MAFPKKKSRRITLDGQTYRWMAKGDGMTVNLSVDPEDIQGSKLFACFNYDTQHKDSNAFHHPFVVTPYITAWTIRYAHTKGYRPTLPGKDLQLGNLSAVLTPELTGPKMLDRFLKMLQNRVSAASSPAAIPDSLMHIIKDTYEMIGNGEWVIAFEDMLSNFHEVDCTLSQQEQQLLKDIAWKAKRNSPEVLLWIQELDIGRQASKS